ncbi:MAG: cell wall-binding repeat-containing protein [Bacillota bacterium]|nr:cell wall-binding repeat-containing protein [Bacillota bacterium]
MQLRKYFLGFVAFLLVFSNLQFAVGATSVTKTTNGIDLKEVREMLDERQQFEEAAEAAKASFSATDKVRVIVELDGEAPIQYATKQNVLYKDLEESTKKSLVDAVEKQQASVKSAISSKGLSMEYKHQFTTAFNGFSGEVLFGDIKKIEALNGVANVYLANEYNRPEFEPNMTTSHDYIQSMQVWADAHFKGEGMVVSVIDSGVDPSHKDFVLSDDTDEYLTEELVNGLVGSEGLKGKFYTEKVPYGYNYYDQNYEIKDVGPAPSEHGMHVAGTVVANGEIMGVAPEAQVLGMKVFSNDPLYPSTWSDIYLAAIDDSIKLGADVLNMSLGSTASFYEANSAEDVAITRAVENGIVSSVSAGNSGHIGRGWDNPFFQNPDIGVVGAPGLNKDTIQVAASGNTAYLYQHSLTIDGTDFDGVGYGIDSWEELPEVELVLISGFGNPADYQGVDVEGKVAVVSRGALSFFDKTQNAAAAGAAGIVVYNNNPNGIFYEDQGGWAIPFMKISYTDGQAIVEALKNGNTDGNVEQLNQKESPEMGRMTEFTSWGTTPSLELKPEITAPGGNIYSTLNDDKYGVKSGTSMAAPHVAGGAALVQQYLKSDARFADLTAEERTRMAKALMMNTADSIKDLYGNDYSPRRQGAGMMQLFAAVDTPAYVVEKNSGEGKVELKAFDSTKVSFTLSATNIADYEVSYKVDTSVLTDSFLEQDNGPTLNALTTGALKGAKVTAPKELTLAAGETKEFTVSIDLANAKVPGYKADGTPTTMDLVENIFVEGFVTLSHKYEADLSVPFLGFYGDWSEPSVMDGFKVLEEDKYYEAGFPSDAVDEATRFVDHLENKDGSLYYGISPNGDAWNDSINFINAYLRNAKEVQYNVLDENGKQVRRILSSNYVRKNYFNAGNGSYYSLNADRAWDGTVKGKVVADGKYYYEINALVDGTDKWQSKKIPVVVDTTAPAVEITAFNEETGKLEWTAADSGVGIDLILVYVNGKAMELAADATSVTLPTSDINDIEVLAVDKVMNIGFDTYTFGDGTEPVIFMNDPEPFGAYATNEVPVSGYVTDDVRVEKVMVNGKEVATTLVNEEGEDRYKFETTVTYEEDGYYDVLITALDGAGNEFGISRKVFVDTTVPTLTVDVPKFVDMDVEEVTALTLLEDNFNYVSLHVNDNHEFEQPFTSPVKIMEPASVEYETMLSLEPGNNHFVFTLTDLGGNTVTKEVTVYRNEVADRVDRLRGADRYATAVELSKEGWEQSDVVVIARGDNYADALAGVPLAHKYNAPLLLTKTASLPDATKAEIERLGAKKVYILGGTAAVSKDVEDTFKAHGLEVKRLSGSDRWSTAGAIATEVAPNGAKGVVVVNGKNFPDALSVASYAAQNGMPILLTNQEELPKQTNAALIALSPKQAIVVGGKAAVSDNVLKSLPNPKRIGGKDRYETAVNVAKHFDLDANHYYVATGKQFADALAGAALAANGHTGILLVGTSVSEHVEGFLTSEGVDTLTVIGGENAVSAKVFEHLARIVK